MRISYYRNLLLFVLTLALLPNILMGQENKKEGTRLKVLCYNLRFGELASLEELAAYIRSVDPDLVALQEVDVRTNRERAPHQNGKDLITELGFRTGLLTAYGRTIDYMGGYYGIGILSRFPFKQTKRIFLPVPEGSREQRALLMADIELPSGNNFTFVSTHLDHSSSSVRTHQVKALQEAFKDHSDPLIIAGDFNAKPDDYEIREGMKGFKQLCNDEYTSPSIKPRAKIDYIFCRPGERWRLVHSVTPIIQLSDHLPVFVEVELYHNTN